MRGASQRLAVEVLPILGQPSTAVGPSDSPFGNPTTWKRHKTFGVIGTSDDFNRDVRQNIREPLAELYALIAAVSKELCQEWMHPEQRRHKQDAAVSVLNVGRMDDRVEQQTQCIDENMGFFAFDLLACIVTVGIDARSAFFCALHALAIDDGGGWTRFASLARAGHWPGLAANLRTGLSAPRRARIARDHSINHAVKQLPWQRLSAIGFEDLNGLKKGKSATKGKNFRKAAAPWTYRRVRQRIECLAAENRVLPIAVDPRGTSRTCPACGEDDRRNRKGEMFRCIACDHTGDADFIGARNILTKTLAALGRVLSPRQEMSLNQ